MTMWPFHRKSPVYSQASTKEPNLPSNQALAGSDSSQTPNYGYGQLDPAAAAAGGAGGFAANGYGYGANNSPAAGYPPTGYQHGAQDPYAGGTQSANYSNPYTAANDPYNPAGAPTAGNNVNNPYAAQSPAGAAGGMGQNEANQIVNSYANQQYQPYPGTQAAAGAQPAGYEPRTADARATNPAYGGPNGYSAYPSENQLPQSTNPGDDPQSNAGYRAGNTGYDPGNTGYDPPGMSKYQSPAGQYSSPGGPADSAASGYRPGSTAGKNYLGGSSGATGATGGY